MSKCIICDLEVEECDCGVNQLVTEDMVLSPGPVCLACGADVDLITGYCYSCDAP